MQHIGFFYIFWNVGGNMYKVKIYNSDWVVNETYFAKNEEELKTIQSIGFFADVKPCAERGNMQTIDDFNRGFQGFGFYKNYCNKED